MRSNLVHRLRSNSQPLTSVPPPTSSAEYSPPLASLASQILYRSPLPSPADLPIFILNAAAFPDSKTTSYDALLPYVLARLPDEEELIGGQGYEVVFFAGGEPGSAGGGGGKDGGKKSRPGWGWFFQAYQVLTRATRKRLKKLYLVHEKNWIRVLVEMFATVVSPRFRKKVVHVNTLSGLALHLPIEDLLIPPSTYLTDRRKSRDIFAPYVTGKRAFGVSERLPVSFDGSLRLPRVLRETTSFVITDPLIKTEGIFRINARAQFVDILKEAYDRGQKFIVWRDGNTVLTYSHYKEGSGDVSVEELDQTEGYEVHAAAGLIKLWYKELRDPIFPQSSYQSLAKFYNDPSVPLERLHLLEMLSEGPEWTPLPSASREVLTLHLLPMCSHISSFSEWNKMPPSNLATCFAPILLCGPDPIEDVRIAAIVRRIFAGMIEHWSTYLAPALNKTHEEFEASLDLPIAVSDREDPLEEARSGSERHRPDTQSSGITMVDNDEAPASPILSIAFPTSPPLSASEDEDEGDDDEEEDEWDLSEEAASSTEAPPPLPPRPRVTTTPLSYSSNTAPQMPLTTSTSFPLTSSSTSTPHNASTTSLTLQPPLKRKPAPAVLPLPRYSVIFREAPPALADMGGAYNTIEPTEYIGLDEYENEKGRVQTGEEGRGGGEEARGGEGLPRYSAHFTAAPLCEEPEDESARTRMGGSDVVSKGTIPRKPVGEGRG